MPSTGPCSSVRCCCVGSGCRVAEVVERLVGMQAQVPGDPYVGLWTRLEPLTKPDATAVTDEGARLLAFLIPGAAAVELREIGEDAQRA